MRLITLLITSILLVWLAVAALVFFVARHEVEEVYDANLAQNARIVQALLLHEAEEEKKIQQQIREVMEELKTKQLATFPRLAALLDKYTTDPGKERIELVEAVQEAAHDYDSRQFFVARYADGSILMNSRSAPTAAVAGDGLADSHDGERRWRTYSLSDEPSGFVVQVGEALDLRRELVSHITGNTLMPLLAALPLIGLLVWFSVGGSLASLQQVAKSVALRAPGATEPIDIGNSPKEIESLLHALNALFGRVAAAINRERQFTADAAHELRTPLAALKTHLQVARAQSAEPKTICSLDQALEGVDRATHSVEQLLLLARADATQVKSMLTKVVDLRELSVTVVSTFSQQAVDRGIDLGVQAPQRVMMAGDMTALEIMLRNLVDNALRYTPAGGEVTVSAGMGEMGAWIEVADDGVGVTAEERDKILQRFHRGSKEQTLGANGSGLGLSIVQRIVDLHAASIKIADGLNGKGLSVRIQFSDASDAPRYPVSG